MSTTIFTYNLPGAARFDYVVLRDTSPLALIVQWNVEPRMNPRITSVIKEIHEKYSVVKAGAFITARDLLHMIDLGCKNTLKAKKSSWTLEMVESAREAYEALRAHIVPFGGDDGMMRDFSQMMI